MIRVKEFLENIKRLVVVVSTLPSNQKEAVLNFLLRLNAPVYLEAVSGLREEPKLRHLQMTYVENIWDLAVDGILRIGGVPTPRFWRDLENKQGTIAVLSVSHLPFSGLSWGEVVCGEYGKLLNFNFVFDEPWYHESVNVQSLLDEFPRAEPSLVHGLSKMIPAKSLLYLGNSMPIRQWDMTANMEDKGLEVFASRGLNGIDGQLSTFLGMCKPGESNWCILGDLTTLYDLAGPWILDQMKETQVQIVVINNGGGMIFSRLAGHERMLNRHQVNFEHFANLWSLKHERWESIGQESNSSRVLEVIPCRIQTEEFWKLYQGLAKKSLSCYS